MSTPAAEAYAKAQEPPAPAGRPGERELNHSDRCDQCGSAAYVRTESLYSMLTLLFCGHHFSEHERHGHFTPETHLILDERSFLTASVKAQHEEDTTNWTGKK